MRRAGLVCALWLAMAVVAALASQGIPGLDADIDEARDEREQQMQREQRAGEDNAKQNEGSKTGTEGGEARPESSPANADQQQKSIELAREGSNARDQSGALRPLQARQELKHLQVVKGAAPTGPDVLAQFSNLATEARVTFPSVPSMAADFPYASQPMIDPGQYLRALTSQTMMLGGGYWNAPMMGYSPNMMVGSLHGGVLNQMMTNPMENQLFLHSPRVTQFNEMIAPLPWPLSGGVG